MNFQRRKSILLLIALSFGFSMANLDAQVTLKTKSELKTIFVPVFCYHRVTPEVRSLYDLTPEMFESQLQYLKDQGYHPITGLQYIKLQKNPEYIPDKPVILTFDDGSIGHYQYVFPLLKKYGFQATFFVYPNVVFENTEKLITWSELAEMAQAGMDIESHTMSHAYLTKPGADPVSLEYIQWLSRELKDSKTLLEQKINRKVTLLGYPYGWYNRVVEAEAARAGYEGAFTVNWGVNRLDENPFRIKRRVVSNNLHPEDFERYLSSRPLSLEIVAPSDAALFTEKPVINFRLTNRELEWLDITVRDEKGVVRSKAEGIFTFDKYQLKRPGYYQITISGVDDQKQLYQSSWGFDYRPLPANEATARNVTPTFRPGSTQVPTPRRGANLTPSPTTAMALTPTSRPRSTPVRRTPTASASSTLTPTVRGMVGYTPTPTRGRSMNTPTSRRSSTQTPTLRRLAKLTPTPTGRMTGPTAMTTFTPTPTQRNSILTPTPRRNLTMTPRPTYRRFLEISPSPTRGMTIATFRPTPTTTTTPTRRSLTLVPTPTR